MIVDGNRLISRDLVQFLDSIEKVAVKKHQLYVKAAKNPRSGQKVHRPRSSGDDEKRKLMQNLRGRVEKISRLCNVYANVEEDLEHEEDILNHDHDDGVTNVLIGRRDEVSPNKVGVFVQRQGVQPRVKKSVRFAENGDIC
ncbi:putative BAG family molecular chaperone regulator 8, chloroplastic-like [Sesbania bispinosa]|nr:putative BAG family molecular chaperone regulator 8, chloroplastic-like [Sesbania bispinosa]